MKVEAESRGAAVAQMQQMMNEDMIASHMSQRHPGEPVPSMTDAHAMVEANMKQVM
ncbi:MAG: hypothetical protein HY006_00100 [Candidatus Sungbacteria bacterium]|nr:hypothetical protein [Candidatus Sungbacteria bacterium]